MNKGLKKEIQAKKQIVNYREHTNASRGGEEMSDTGEGLSVLTVLSTEQCIELLNHSVKCLKLIHTEP